MSRMRIAFRYLLAAVIWCAPVFGSQQPADTPPQEFPVTLRQKIVAGVTPVGTRVEANLTMATLVSGKVVPVGATFSGEVVESSAKSTDAPSRLAIRMNDVRWKKGSIDFKAYLTAWYYPPRSPLEDHEHDRNGIHGDIGMQRGGPPESPEPYPGHSSPNGLDLPPAPTSSVSDHRVLMKDVEPENESDGTIAIKSTHFNIKLDKSTTYVLATGELLPSSK
jgi:hypothetical protein